MNKITKISIISLLSLGVILGTGGVANAALTLGANVVSNDGVLTLTGNDVSVWSVAAAADDDDLTVAATGAHDMSLILSSAGTGADALQILTTVGGMDITVGGNLDGEDLDITTTGTTTEMRLTSASTTADAIDIVSAGGIDITAADDVDFTLAAGAGGEDFTIALTGAHDASLILSSEGTGVDAISLTASAGDIVIDSSTANKEIQLDTGTGDVVITGTNGSDALTVAAGDVAITSGSIIIAADDDNAATLSVTNDTATTASPFVFAGSGTFTGSTTSSFMTVTPSGLTSGTAVYLPLAAMANGKGLHVVANVVTTGNVLHITSSSTAAASGELATIALTSSTDGLTAKTGNVASVASSRTETGANSTADDYDALSVIRTNITSGSGTMTAAGSALYVGVVNTQSAGTLTATLNGIEVAYPAIGTGNAVKITDSHTTTKAAVLITASGATSTGSLTVVNDALTTGTALSLTSTGTIATTGDVLSIVANGATTSTGLLRISGTGLTDGFCAEMTGGGASASTTGGVLKIDASDATTGSALDIVNTGDYASGAPGIVAVVADSATAGDIVTVSADGLTTGNVYVANRAGAGLLSGGALFVANMGAAVAGAGVEIVTTGDYAGTDGVLDIDANTATSGDIVSISATSLTTGSAIKITTNTTATGYYLECFDGAAADFTVSRYGATTIAGNASGTDALTLTKGDITVSDGDVTLDTGHVVKSIEIGITASATESVAGGTALTKDINVVDTAGANDAVTLPTAIAGLEIRIINRTDQTITVWPDVTGNGINALTANTAYNVATLVEAVCTAMATTSSSATAWECQKMSR